MWVNIDIDELIEEIRDMSGYYLAYPDQSGFDQSAYIEGAVDREDVIERIREYIDENC